MKTIESNTYFAAVNGRINYADKEGLSHEEKLKSILSFDMYSRYLHAPGSLLEAEIEQAKIYAAQSCEKAFRAFSVNLSESVRNLTNSKNRKEMIETLSNLRSVYGTALTRIGYGISLSAQTSEIICEIAEMGDTNKDDEALRKALEEYYSALLTQTVEEITGDTERYELIAAACMNLSNAGIYPDILNLSCAESATDLTIGYMIHNGIGSVLVNSETRKMLLGTIAEELVSLVFCVFYAAYCLRGFIASPHFMSAVIILFFGAFTFMSLEKIVESLMKMYPQGLNETPLALKIRDTLNSIKKTFAEMKQSTENEEEVENEYINLSDEISEENNLCEN